MEIINNKRKSLVIGATLTTISGLCMAAVALFQPFSGNVELPIAFPLGVFVGISAGLGLVLSINGLMKNFRIPAAERTEPK